LIRAEGSSVENLATELRAFPVPAEAFEPDPAKIAEEFCRIASADWFYPQRKLDEAYIQAAGATMRVRLVLAGARLAKLLASR
jgi:hypothetical protein